MISQRAMTDQLPSLKALRAFATVARTGSFTRAARELNVTHGAVSRAVRGLEQDLGLRLLERTPSGATPTPAGARLANDVGDSLARIRATWMALRLEQDSQAVTLTLSTSLALKWLVPRLASFHAEHPAVSLRLVTDDRVLDLAQDGIDGALRFGPGAWDGCARRLTVSEHLVAVAGSGLLERAGLAGRQPGPEAVTKLPLLEDEIHGGWDAWATRAGIQFQAKPSGATFRDSAVLIAAVMSGRGVALVRHLLAAEDLAAGRLVRVSPIAVPLDSRLCIVVPSDRPRRPAWRFFEDWLGRELRITARAIGLSVD
jgi:LysR family glycine cleavage system transcriptional activator